MKIAILVNEDFNKMVVGVNTTLSYILSCVDLGFEVFICEFHKQKLAKKINAISLNSKNCGDLVKKFQEENQRISFVNVKNYQILQEKILVENIKNNFDYQEISFDEIDFVIQRLEPMKPPFPPYGKVDIVDFLREFSTEIFTKNKNYNLPIDCFGDKELPLMFDDKNVAVPTSVSFLNDLEIVKKVRNFGKKIILKPDNSAQAFGVFAIEFDENGFDLENILQEKISNLILLQTFKIKDVSDENLQKILNILFFIQDLKIKKEDLDKSVFEFSNEEILTKAQNIFGNKILIQPFIQGVKNGDVRVVLAKSKKGDFEVIGEIFRKNISIDDKNFTTGIMSGSSIPAQIQEFLTIDEISDLRKKTDYILTQLNEKLRKKYQFCQEIGLDFLLIGDGQKVLLGEANHYCQGVIPLLEAVIKNQENFGYDGGLKITKQIILNNFK